MLRFGGTLLVQSIRDIKSLTGLRGVAAVYVVIFHYFPLAASENWLKRCIGHGYLAVDLFFVLSGFVMALNYRHLFAAGWSPAAYAKFLGRRIARIYPLYLVAILVGFIFVGMGWLQYGQTFPLAIALPLNLLMVQAWGLAPSFDSPAWSISAEWAAYLLFPAVLIPVMFRKPWIAWMCALASLGLLAALCLLPRALFPEYLAQYPLNMNGYWMGLPVLRCVPEFTLGILAFRLAGTSIGRGIGSNSWIMPLLCLAALTVVALPDSDLALVILLPLIVIGSASEANVIGRLLSTPLAERIGKLSFSIYLTHKLLLGLLTWLYVCAHAAGLAHARSLAALTCVALTVGLAYLAYRFIEIPGRRFLRDRFESGGRPAFAPAGPYRQLQDAIRPE